MPEASFPFEVETGVFKKQIDDREDPSKNHPIHDAVERVSYGQGRYELILVLDGVSESKSQKLLVPIGRMLSWDLARLCQEKAPEEIQELVTWFAGTVEDPRYAGKGSTTVSLLRLDRQEGRVDGFTAGDSPALLAVDRLEEGGEGLEALHCRAEVLAPLHCVANYPGIITNGWRHGTPFTPSVFHFDLPERWESAYLVAMSDGYGKIGEEISRELCDYNEADAILAARFPDFARVYLPASLAKLAPNLPRSPDGRVLRAALAEHRELWEALSTFYDDQATEEERREMEIIDLDCLALHELIKKPPETVTVNGRSGVDILASSHKTLTWMRETRYMDAEDETGLEEYLRQYIMAELFTEAMIAEVFDPAAPPSPVARRLHAFGTRLGPVADDYSVAVMRITRAAR